MSYNGGYNYSPYFQHGIATGTGDRGQDSYQNNTNANRQYPSQVYSSNTQATQYQALPAYTQQQQPQQQSQQSSFAPATSSADRSSASYRYGDGPTPSQYQDSRGEYGHTPRSATDTTALGNLAHASTLDDTSRTITGTRDNASLQQIIDYNRSRNSYGYGGSIAYDTAATGYNYSHERSDSRGTAGSGDGCTRASQMNQNQTAAQYHPTQHTTTAGHSNPTPAYSASQGVSYTTSSATSYASNTGEQSQRTQQYYAQPAQPARPASGQNHHVSAHSSQPSQQARQSPTLPVYRSSVTSSMNVHPTQKPEKTPARALPLPKPAKQQPAVSTAPASVPAQETRNYYSISTPSNPHVQQQSSSVPSSARSHQTSVHSDSRTSISPEDQALKTVDPSQVFNQVEYQRRQAAAAETAKAAEVEEARKATEAATALKRVSEGNQPSSNGTTMSSGSTSIEEEMAAEMRLMIEKIRDYKSKDPSLFSQVWEQMKKTQPANTLPAAPPLSVKDIAVPAVEQDIQTNGTVTADVDDELPDLGRFPAQRRRRGPNINPTKKRKSAGLSETIDPSLHVNGLGSSLPVNTSKPGGPPSSPKFQITPNSSLTKAVNMNRQIVYVSGAGPQQSPAANQASTVMPAPSSGPPATPAPIPPPVTASGNTNWPEHNKWDLAVAAKYILLRHPLNSNKAKDISAEQILGFLNQNPTFEELCRMIEAKGFILERSHFARSLLNAIPDMEAGIRHRQQNTVQPPPTRAPLTNGADYSIMTPKPNGIPAYLKAPQTNGAPVAQMTPSQAQPSSTPEAEKKPNVPLTKQEMARKRTIADVVDLSQLSDSDDDDPPPRPKIPQTGDLPQAAGSSQMLPSNYHNHPQAQYQPFQQPGMPLWGYGPPLSFPSSQYHPPPSHKPFPAPQPSQKPPLVPPPQPSAPALPNLSAQQRELVNSEDIVRPMDKRKVRKRTKYNPKTIVRDVLLAAGRHSTMQPLNYHLEHLRDTFKYVNDLSDMSTFRWDLVDPGEPVLAVTPAPERTLVEHGEGNDADDEDAEVPVTRTGPQMTLEVDPAGSASVSTSVHPSGKNLVPKASVWAYVLMTIVNLPRPPKNSGPQHRSIPGQASTSAKPDKSWMSSGFSSFRAQASSELPTRTPQTTTSATSTPGTPSTGSTSTIRKRGRPPGAKNKNPRKSTGTPTQSSNMPARPRIDTTPARPSSLRNAVSSTDGVAVVVPSSSPSIGDSKRPRGRPPKKSPRTSQQTSPVFRIYKCKWKNCQAELHNLETLKKHVHKHGDKYAEEGGPIPCLWKGCGQAPTKHEDEMEEDNDEADSKHQPLEFGTHNVWAKHIDRRHIIDDAWKLGDGSNNRSDSEMSDYVSDSAKRQVTPIIHNNGQARPDPLPLTADCKPAKTYHKAHRITTELGKAKAFIEACEGRRKKFGPGMDRVGVSFVTDEKRALLNDKVTPLRRVTTAGQEEDDSKEEED
ncbi:MAG: hypothetical protein Q9218_004940 [Villophora microphyllina]